MYICIDCKIQASGRSDRKRCPKCFKIYENNRKKEYEHHNPEARAKSYKKYRDTEQYRQYSRTRYYSLPKNKRMARYSVTNAIRDKKLTRPNYCDECGIKDWGKGRSMIEAHHYLGYDKENWLRVKWLCSNCHKLADRKEA